MRTCIKQNFGITVISPNHVLLATCRLNDSSMLILLILGLRVEEIVWFLVGLFLIDRMGRAAQFEPSPHPKSIIKGPRTGNAIPELSGGNERFQMDTSMCTC